MDKTKVSVDKFKEDIRFKHRIAHIETIPPRKAKYEKVEGLSENIINYLDDIGFKLYSHQAKAFNSIKNQENIIITTPTASGKTLAFNLPILDDLSSDDSATALYIYPAKALSNDQLNVLTALEMDLGIDIKPATYDGDTSKSKKYGIRQNSRIVLTNPYQLHHILSWHHQWAKFYKNLKYVVIDESHQYKGVFGSNVAFLIRRLKRIAKHYGSNPQFILSSATLANPTEFASKLVGEPFTLIDNDTSPSGEKDFILYNPFVDKRDLIADDNSKNNSNNNSSSNNGNTGPNKVIKSNKKDSVSIHQETEIIFMYLLLKDIQTLCFTVSRKIAELIAMWAKQDILQHKSNLNSRITAYRAGYLADERREIEAGLKSRKYLGVTCTNALELGINIGSLDAVVISGYPGTMISTWQQAGRAGRENQKSLVILVAFENQLDQYFMNNPDFFFDKPHENAIIDLNNNKIRTSHILCAANELVLEENEIEEFFSEDFNGNGINGSNSNIGSNGGINSTFGTNNSSKAILNKLMDSGILNKNPIGYAYDGEDSPSFKHSLDQISSDTFRVMSNGKLLEQMDISQVYREAHEGAVLINKGETYIVDGINFAKKFVNVSKHTVDYHTIVLKDTETNIINKVQKTKIGSLNVNFGELEVLEDFYKYKKVQFSKTIGTYILDLPTLKFNTKGLWFTIPKEIKEELENKFNGDDDKDVFAGGLHGVEHALISLFPLHVMCDRFDIGGLSTNWHEDTQEATIFIYDAYEGGIGISEKAAEVFRDLTHSTLNLIKNCKCKDGCPSCIYSPKCGNENKPLHKKATEYILEYMVSLFDADTDISASDNINSNNNIDNNSNNNGNNNSNNASDIVDNGFSSDNDIIDISSSSTTTITTTINTTSYENKYIEAEMFFKEGNYIYAKEILSDLISSNKDFADAWYLLGAILYEQGDPDSASFLM
ncbi:MAG: DEAD/DEAH box helicase, partial [Methanobacteriaceae archaeon]